MRNFLIIISLSVLAASCGGGDSASTGTSASSSSALVADDVAALDIKPSSGKIAWESSYTAALSEQLSSADIEQIYDIQINEDDLDTVKCSNFNSLSITEKRRFYIVYLAAIAEAESDYKNSSSSITPSNGSVNIGLLQIDESSANRHTKGALGNDIKSEDLKEPTLNLKVGTYILKNQLTSTKHSTRLFPRSSYYWSVLTSRTRVLNTIKRNYSNLSFCNN